MEIDQNYLVKMLQIIFWIISAINRVTNVENIGFWKQQTKKTEEQNWISNLQNDVDTEVIGYHLVLQNTQYLMHLILKPAMAAFVPL